MRHAVRLVVALVFVSLACSEDATPRPVRIACIGDSITYGVDGDALRADPRSFGSRRPLPVDRVGGYPGRLTRRLGDRARVLGRGITGGTTLLWLKDLRGSVPIDASDLSYAKLFRMVGWDGFDAEEELRDAPSVLLATLRADQPDVVILLIGVNDLVPELVPQGPDIAELTAGRLGRLRRQAESVADHVLVSTLLPNERDPPDVLDRLNARIRSEHPDFLPLGEEFAARAWRELLADGIHPNEAGYELLAEVLEDQLIGRGLVRPADRRD